MATYTNITQQEIEAFLKPQGFQELKLAGVREKVYAKRVDQIVQVNDDILGKRPLSLRVFTGIEEGKSREVGKDAIRVTVFWRDSDGRILMAGGSKRVHRVEGWKQNLQARLDAWEASLGPVCKCGAPMVKRKPRDKTKKPFYGCARYPICTNTREMS